MRKIDNRSTGQRIYESGCILTALFIKQFGTELRGIKDILLTMVAIVGAALFMQFTFKPLTHIFPWLDKKKN